MGYAIIRQIKIKAKDEWNGISAHNKRETSPKNVQKQNTHKNITLIKNPYRNFDDFIEKKRTQIREANKKNGTNHRMLKKNTKGKYKDEIKSTTQELIFTHSHDAMTEAESIEFLKLALEFIKEFYPELEIISAVIHLDEETPHIHIDVAYFDVNQCRFIQKFLQDAGRTDFDNIRDAWENKLKDTKFEKLKRQDGSVVGDKHDGSKADIHIAELKKQTAHAEKTALLQKLVAVAAQAELAEKTSLATQAKSEGEERIQELVAQIELAEKVVSPEKTVEVIKEVEIEKIVEVVKEVEVEVEKIVIEEDTTRIQELETRLAISEHASEAKDAQIANLKHKLKSLVATVQKYAHSFINSLSIQETNVLDKHEEALVSDNPFMTREAMKKEDVGIKSNL